MDYEERATPPTTGSRPPVTRSTHLLPFSSLSPAEFERLCLALVRREGYDQPQHLGAAGSDDGRDIVAFREGRRVVFQCKRYEKLGPRDAEDVVGDILALPADEWPAELILLATRNVSAEARRRAGARRPQPSSPLEANSWGNGKPPLNPLKARRLQSQQSDETRSARWDCDPSTFVTGARYSGSPNLSEETRSARWDCDISPMESPANQRRQSVGGDQIIQVGLRRKNSELSLRHNLVGGDQSSQVGLRL
jgi:Restriction endonuclease